MKVFVYFNLHRKLFSIKALEGPMKGRVVAHRYDVLLTDAAFKVSEAGRQRVIREKKKNVHAGVEGQWAEHPSDFLTVSRITTLGTAITYNPYKYDSFVHLYGEHPIKSARIVVLNTINRVGKISAWD